MGNFKKSFFFVRISLLEDTFSDDDKKGQEIFSTKLEKIYIDHLGVLV